MVGIKEEGIKTIMGGDFNARTGRNRGGITEEEGSQEGDGKGGKIKG